MEILKDPNTLMHGRQGQAQSGVDVYGINADTLELYGIQCKGKDKLYGAQLTEKELRSEVASALTFMPNCNNSRSRQKRTEDRTTDKLGEPFNKQDEGARL
jgi:hypothetical protein